MTTPIEDAVFNELRGLYGVGYSKQALIELDHKAHYSKKLPHGPEFAQTCGLCLAEVARKQALREREERLMNEFVGETIWIRTRGYKTMRRAVVEIYNKGFQGIGEGVSHHLHLDWKDESRGNTVDSMMRVDVVVDGDRWTLWDDGLDDLSPWEREKLPNSSRPSKGAYDEKFNN